MTEHRFVDRVPVSGTRRRDDGSLVADARVARTGIQLYLGSEVGRPDTKYVRVYRPGEEVFSEDSVRTLAHRPVTMGHPPEMVDASNWKKYAVGQTGDEIVGEKIYLRVPLMVSDGAAVARIEDGESELSCGYYCQLDWTAGETPDGELYDAVQRSIRYNHVAAVRRGRAGGEVRIGDGAGAGEWGTAPVDETVRDEEGGTRMPNDLTTVVVDGLSVSTTDQGAQAIRKLEGQVTDSRQQLQRALDEHTQQIAAKDKDIADRDTQIGELKAQLKKLEDAQMDTAAIDKRVAERAELVAVARTIDKDIKTEGVSDADIRRAVCVKKFGDEMVRDSSDDQVAGMFRVAAKDAKPEDPFSATIRGGGGQPTADAAQRAVEARDKFHSDLQNGWKQLTTAAAQ